MAKERDRTAPPSYPPKSYLEPHCVRIYLMSDEYDAIVAASGTDLNRQLETWIRMAALEKAQASAK